MSKLAVSLRLLRFLSISCSLLFFGLAAFLLGHVPEANASGRGLRVEPSLKSLGDFSVGTTVPITFTVTNLSSNPVRLAGIKRVCMRWGCVEGKDFPVSIPPRTSREISLELRNSARKFSGEFAGEIILYSDAPGNEQTPLRLTGRVIRSAGQ